MRRRQLLGLLGAGTVVPKFSFASTGSTQRLLVVYSQGGWDVSMLFDPKFSSRQIDTASDGEVRSVGGLTYVDSPNRPNVRAFMDQFANQSVIINGIGVGSISHTKCERLLFTGSRLQNAPDFGSIIAQRFSTLPLPYAILTGPRMTGELGYNVSRVDQTFVSILRQESVVDYDLVQSYLSRETSESASDRLSEYWETLERRQRLQQSVDLFPSTVSSNPSDQIDLSLNLLSNNVTAVSMIQILPPPFHQWDTHSNNDNLQSGCFDYLFQYVHQLASQLQSTLDNSGQPLIETTTVVVLSEMGRTPVYNSNAGKDHWPYTSMLMFGNKIRGGSVVGATDDRLITSSVGLDDGQPASKGVSIQSGHLLAGLLTAFDIDPGDYFAEGPFTAPFS